MYLLDTFLNISVYIYIYTYIFGFHTYAVVTGVDPRGPLVFSLLNRVELLLGGRFHSHHIEPPSGSKLVGQMALVL